MKTKISEIINAIANDLVTLATDVAAEYNIMNDFDKIMQVQVSNKNNPVISLIFNDYIEYTNDVPNHKYSSIDRIRDWALSHNIPPDNKILWNILQSLKKNSISGSSIKDIIAERIELNRIDKWSDQLCDAIIGELELVFYK